MVPLASLWLPILLSAVLVFVASAIIWMALPFHKGDYSALPDEDSVLEALRRQSPRPGVYMVPWCDHKTPTEAQKSKLESGPWGQVILAPAKPSMGPTLGGWFVYLIIVSVFVAYITGLALPPSASYLHVFQVAGASAVLAYAVSAIPRCIWEGKPWKQLPVAIIDGVIYGLLTAGTFGWLWPKAAAGIVLP